MFAGGSCRSSHPTSLDTRDCHPASLDQTDFPPATGPHLLQLQFVSCQGDFLPTTAAPTAFQICIQPSHQFRPGKFLTSYCCSPIAFEVCILLSHQFRPGRFLTSYCCSPTASEFVSCRPTSLDQGDFPPATAAHLLQLKFVPCYLKVQICGMTGYKFQRQ